MRWMVAALTVLALATAGLWLWARNQPRKPGGAPVVVETILTDDEKHRVTPEMEEASAAQTGLTLPPLRLEGSDGTVHDLGSIAGQQPAALIFIKDGCPCSAAAEPYFRRLFAAYGTHVRFLAIIDGDRATAQRWIDEHGTPFPVAHDPGLDTMRALGVTNSAHLALVDQGGTVRRLWPGFSKGMLAEASEQLAEMADVPVRGIDAADAPEALYTGCPFEIGPLEPEGEDQDSSATVDPRRPA